MAVGRLLFWSDRAVILALARDPWNGRTPAVAARRRIGADRLSVDTPKGGNPFEGLPIGDHFRGMQAADIPASPNRSKRNWPLKLIVDAFVDPTPHNFAPID